MKPTKVLALLLPLLLMVAPALTEYLKQVK